MPKIREYEVEGSQVRLKNTPEEVALTMFFERSLKTNPESSADTVSDDLMRKALSSDKYSVYLIGPSDEVKVNRKNFTVTQSMLAVIDYSQHNPVCKYIQLKSYQSSGGVGEGYRLSNEPIDFSEFPSDLQKKYMSVVAHETKLAQQAHSSTSDEPEPEDDFTLGR